MSIAQSPAAVDQRLVSLEKVEKSIAVVTLQRPEALNAVNPAMAAELENIVAQVEHDESLQLAILTGHGDRSFCAGADLKEIAQGRLEKCFTQAGGFGGFVNATRVKPWIAAVNGFALAGGFEMVLACDLAVSADTAFFGLPEVKRGLIASAGGLYRLPRILPRVVAMELITTGRMIDAQRALSLGVVNRIVARADLIEEAMRLAKEICANAPLAVRESVRIARMASGFDDPVLRMEAERTQARLQNTEDYSEGSRAFIQKRSPHWQAR